MLTPSPDPAETPDTGAVRGKRRGVRRRTVLAVLIGGGFVFVVSLYWVTYYAVQVNKLSHDAGQTMFSSAAGQPWFPLEEHRMDIPIGRMATDLQHAVIAVEDKRFYTHSGVDPISIVRASVRNVQNGEIVEGASTLTQQLARLLFLSNSQTFSRKLKEAVIATMIEVRLSKQRILELYLNRIYFGGDVYGVEAMSRNMFGKAAAELSLSESALMAGLIRSPSVLWPWSHFDQALERSHVVLERMRDQGFITAEEEKAARSTSPRILPRPGLDRGPSGYAAQFLRSEFHRRFGDDNPSGWNITTTFVPELQAAAEAALTEGLKRFRLPKLEAALVAIDPRTGDILALVGGKDFGLAPFNRAVSARRQPGSAFKPFVYAAALEEGFSPVSIVRGLNTLTVVGHEEWTVRNVSDRTEDELALRDAFLESDNRAAVAVLAQIGSKPVLRLARLAGLGEMPDVPSLALGTGEVTPLELTAAYAVFPNGGSAVMPRALARVVNARGTVVLHNLPQLRPILSDATAFQMVTMLQDVIDRGTGAAARSLGVKFAGKTGTTDDFRDAWFVGFSSSIVAGVWTGLDQPASIAPNAYGSRYALPIWADFMTRAAHIRPPQPFEVPPSLDAVALCQESHQRASPYCPVRQEYFKSGDVIPEEECYLHGNFSFGRAVGGFFRRFGRWIGR
jgi:1A family penicillin-binding protein